MKTLIVILCALPVVARAELPSDVEVASAVKCKKESCTIPASMMAELADNLPALMNELRLTAETRDGDLVGYRISSLRKGSILAKLGYRNDDIVKSVNGHPLSDPTASIGVYQSIAGDRKLVGEILRGRKSLRLSCDVR